MPYIYLDLLKPDGSRNMVAFAELLAGRVEAEVNLALCCDAGLRVPRHIGFGEHRAWRRAQVKARNLGPISKAARDKIADHELSRLDEWAKAMQGAAEGCRLAWLAASHRSSVGEFAVAAE